MKIRIIMFLVSLGILDAFSASPSKTQIIRLVQNERFPMASASLPYGGFACRVAKEAFALHGHKMTIAWHPTKRVLIMVKKGAADMSLGWRKTPERESSFTFNDAPLISSATSFYYLKGTDFTWNTIQDLSMFRIGYRIGAKTVPKAFWDAVNSGDLVLDKVATDQLNVKKLMTRRIDVMIGNPITTPFLLKKMLTPEQQSQITVHPKPLLEDKYYAVFNKQFSPKLIQTFDDGIRQLRENGLFEKWRIEALQQ
ncbi:MAG: transporter substrate-binding domain-containing protein [Desulfobacter sp.]|nr:MAG: transporter substrate-binding domain-containing protein [Desulfobacter sp.]